MLGAVFAHHFAARPTVMLPLCNAEVGVAAVAVVGRLIGRPVGSHRTTVAQLFGDLRTLLHLRHLQLCHAELNAELFERLLVFVVFSPQPIEIRLRLFMLFSLLRVLTNFQLQLRDKLLVLPLLRLQRRPPLTLNPQIGFAATPALFARHNLRR